MASLSLEPAEIQTYPEALITATLRFQTTFCEPVVNSLEPETWLNLLYCGHSPLQCTFSNNTHKQVKNFIQWPDFVDRFIVSVATSYFVFEEV